MTHPMLPAGKDDDLTIESGVPMPARMGGGKKGSKFACMNVGDSLLDIGADSVRSSRIANYAQAWGCQQSPKRRFSGRKVDGGVRVWRVS